MAARSSTITVPEIKMERHTLYLVGTAPLIVHAFPEKARKAMLDKQMKESKGGRDKREPGAEVEAARYVLPDGRDGFPAVAFKAAAVTACTSLSDVTKVGARQAFRVEGAAMNASGIFENSFVRTALVPLVAGPHRIREDVVRLSGAARQAEMRYRPEFNPWGVELVVVLNTQVVSINQLATMFVVAGHGVGVGDYRPERDGDAGTFELVGGAQFQEWRKSHSI